MRKLIAYTTPQEIANSCRSAIEHTTLQRALPVLPGSEFDHLAFVVDHTEFDELSTEFMHRIDFPHLINGHEGARVLAGFQAKLSGICWYAGENLPVLALVEATPGLTIPAGGAYTVIRYRSLRQAFDTLRRMELSFERTTLYGRDVFAVDCTGFDYEVGPGIYRLYITGEDYIGEILAGA